MGTDGSRCDTMVSQGCESAPQLGRVPSNYKDIRGIGWGGRIPTPTTHRANVLFLQSGNTLRTAEYDSGGDS
jgi:hypothetical protein